MDDSLSLALESKINEITPALRRKIGGLKDSTLTADDLFQEAVEAIIKRACANPDFLKEKNAYILQAGFWAAQHRCESSRVVASHTFESSEVSLSTPLFGTANNADRAAVDGDAAYDSADNEIFDLFQSPDPSPEAAAEYAQAIRDLVDAVQKISPENQVIVKMLFVGAAESEIAQALHITRPAVSQRKKTIAAQLARYNISNSFFSAIL